MLEVIADGRPVRFVSIDPDSTSNQVSSQVFNWFGYNYIRIEDDISLQTLPVAVSELLPFGASATFSRPLATQMIEGAEDVNLYKIHRDYLLYLGSQDAARHAAALKDKNVALVVNVATGIEVDFHEGIKYLNLPILDTPESNLLAILDAAMDAISETLHCGGGVLVHCNAGVSRSASVVIAWLMKEQRMSYDEAYGIVKAVKRDICPNRGFEMQLRSLSFK